MKTAKIKPSVAINNATQFCWVFFFFYFQPDLSWLLLVTFCSKSWCASALLWPSLSQGTKPRHQTADSSRTELLPAPCPGCSGTCPWLCSSPWLAKNHDTALFSQQLLLLLGLLNSWHAGSTFIVRQPRYSLSNWCAADLRNPRAGVGGLVCSVRHCNA